MDSVVSYLDYMVFTLLPAFFNRLGSYMIAPGVSFLQFSIAIILLVVVIGAVLMRV